YAFRRAAFRAFCPTSPSAYCSPTSTACLLRWSVMSVQTLRPQATANSRAFRSVSWPLSRRKVSIACGSVDENQSASVTTEPSLPARQEVDAPAAAVVRPRPPQVAHQFGVGPSLLKGVRQDRKPLRVQRAGGHNPLVVGCLGEPGDGTPVRLEHGG